jgi:receptor protein-tyrosine kinase
MSLIEQAAKRLGELGKAGSQVLGDLAYPSSHGEAAPNLIERAVQKREAVDAKRTTSKDAAPRVDEAATTIADEAMYRTTPARHEPKLGDVEARVSAPASGPLHSRGARRSGKRVELDFPTLASVGYLTPEDPESALANEFRRIKRPLIQACNGKSPAPIENANRIMVTSSVEGEGKTFVALNLALSIATERDSTVLLIDADTTRSSLSRLVRINSQPGLLDLLAGEQMEVSDALLSTNIERLTLLPAGAARRHATELLASEAMENLIRHLASEYEDRILIFDAPPLLAAPEPAVLASHMGQIIVIVEADRTTHKVLTNALATIQSCPVVRTVLNKTSSVHPGYSYAG